MSKKVYGIWLPTFYHWLRDGQTGRVIFSKDKAVIVANLLGQVGDAHLAILGKDGFPKTLLESEKELVDRYLKENSEGE